VAKKKQSRSWDMKVTSITKTEREKANEDRVTYTLQAEDKEGLNRISISSCNKFTGISPRDGVIQVVLKNSQKALSDFEVKKSDPEPEVEEEK
jgi:hypothetical protein